MMVTISKIYCEIIRQDNRTELSDIRLNCRIFKSKGAHGVATGCRQVRCSQEMATPSHKAECVLRYNETKYVIRV
jgi:hypothetical protein